MGKNDLTKDFLQKQYWDLGKSINEIAEECNLNRNTVFRELKNTGRNGEIKAKLKRNGWKIIHTKEKERKIYERRGFG